MMRPLGLLCGALVLSTVVVACEEPRATEPVARGRQVFGKLSCAQCHFIDGKGGRLGPELEHIGTVAESRDPGRSAAEYIRRSIEDPGAYVVPGYNDVMPRGLARSLSQSDLDALVQYLLAHR